MFIYKSLEILGLYARGHSVEDVRSQLMELYGVEVSAGTISRVTDRIFEEITAWQQRPLDPCYSIIYLDAIHYKIRQEGKVSTKAVYTVYGVSANGERDLLGMYLSESEGARFWGMVLEDIKRRGVEEVLFFCVDGLNGFKEVIADVFPKSTVQRCIVHMVRSSTKYVSYKDIKAVCSDLRTIYTSANREQAAISLESFGQKWDSKYKEIRQKWEQNWEELIAFMDFNTHIRRMIYTTNPVESLHRTMRKVTKTKGAWVSENALIKQLYLHIKINEKSWKRKAFHWAQIQRELIDHFGDRYEKYI
jgi:putative transposase